MEQYTAKEIGGLLTSSHALSSIEAYAFGFMTGFVNKENTNELLKRIIASRPDSSHRFAKLLYDLSHIQATAVDNLTTYFQEIEKKIESEFSLLSKVQLFFFGRFHSLYNEADIHQPMSEANQQNKIRRDSNDYCSEKKILEEIKTNLKKKVNLQSLPHRNLQKLFKIESEQEELGAKQVDQNIPINMEVEIEEERLDQKVVPEHRSPPPQAFNNRVAKKSSKNPPKKPESPIQHQNSPKKPETPIQHQIVPDESLNFQGYSMLAPTNSFSLGLLTETFKLNTQMQSQYNINNTNHFGQFFAPEKNVQPTVIDLEDDEEIVVDKKLDLVVQQSNPIVPPSMLIEDELKVVNKTSPKTLQKESNDTLEPKYFAKVVLNALLSDKKKRTSPDKSSNNSEKKKSPKLKTKKEKPQPKQIHFEQQEEEKTTIQNPMNSDDIYDISYCSSDDVSYMSSPRLPDDDPKELVLSYKSDNELEEDRELSFDGNVNVFCQS